MTASRKARLEATYNERDRVVALAAALAWGLGYVVWVGRVSNAKPGFTHACYISLPTGQVSWHIRDEELPLFANLPYEDGEWAQSAGGRYSAIEAFVQHITARLARGQQVFHF